MFGRHAGRQPSRTASNVACARPLETKPSFIGLLKMEPRRARRFPAIDMRPRPEPKLAAVRAGEARRPLAFQYTHKMRSYVGAARRRRLAARRATRRPHALERVNQLRWAKGALALSATPLRSTVRKSSSNSSVDTAELGGEAGAREHGGDGERRKHASHDGLLPTAPGRRPVSSEPATSTRAHRLVTNVPNIVKNGIIIPI